MITITPAAALQIQQAALVSKAPEMPLRIEIQQLPNGRFHYIMGFDEAAEIGDVQTKQYGVEVVIGLQSQALADGMTLDFVPLEGRMEFVFLNPNDPNYQPPQET